MLADRSLTPREAIRLCALGTLALKPCRYADLAVSVRHFLSRVVGPTPEIMGHSIELLRYEGLVEAIEGDGDTALLALTENGRTALTELLTSNLRAGAGDLNKLVIALKFRFLHLLPEIEQRNQADLLLDATERELSRLEDLEREDGDQPGYFDDWLEQNIAELKARLAWLTTFRAHL